MLQFTVTELNKIAHALEVATREYEDQMNTSKVSDEPYSSYQIFKRQIKDASILRDRILNTPV